MLACLNNSLMQHTYLWFMFVLDYLLIMFYQYYVYPIHYDETNSYGGAMGRSFLPKKKKWVEILSGCVIFCCMSHPQWKLFLRRGNCFFRPLTGFLLKPKLYLGNFCANKNELLFDNAYTLWMCWMSRWS